MFNHPVSGLLPNSLTELKFGRNFDQCVNELPMNLTGLHFGNNFNQEIKQWSPDLEKVSFGAKFNKPIDNISHKVWYLTIGRDYDHSLKNKLPPKLSHLHLNCKYSPDLLENVPESLFYLCLPYKLRELVIPDHIKKITYEYPSKIQNSYKIVDPNFVFVKLPSIFSLNIYLKDMNKTTKNVNVENFNEFIRIPNGSMVKIDNLLTIISSTKEGLNITTPEPIDRKITLPSKTIVHSNDQFGHELPSSYEGYLLDKTEIILPKGTWICKSESSNIMKVNDCIAFLTFE